MYLCFVWFVWFDSLRPINNLSVIKGRVFLGWTSTKLGLMFLLKDTMQWRRWGSNLRSRVKHSTTEPLRSHVFMSLKIVFILANSADPDEITHFKWVLWQTEKTIHRGLCCLQRKNCNIYFEIITCDPSMYTMDHSDLIVCSFMEKGINLKRVFFANQCISITLPPFPEQTFMGTQINDVIQF